MRNCIQAAIVLATLLSLSQGACGQDSEKHGRFFSEPIMTDSASTLMIPLAYSMELFASNKVLSWGDYYSNIIVYDFRSDTYRKLFAKDTFIAAFDIENLRYSNSGRSHLKNFSREWIFYFVKPTDFNGNGKFDDKDPNVLFVTNRRGEGLKSLSPVNENVISMDVYEKQGLALVKMQRDANHDNDFKSEDKDFYLIKIDLSTLKWGNKIEIGNTGMN